MLGRHVGIQAREGGTGLSPVSIGSLATELAELSDRVEQIRGESEINREKARLLRPFSWAVFGFACVYCIVVFVFIMLDGTIRAVDIDEGALRILAGSAGFSAASIVTIIVAGLFRSG